MSNKNLTENIKIVSKMIYGNWIQQCTYVFAELAIADILEKSPMNLTDLSSKLGLKQAYFKQFMRCVLELGFVDYDKETKLYTINDFGNILGSNHPYSKRSEARLNGADYRYLPWGNLVNILKNGNNKMYSPTLENGSLDYLQNRTEDLNVFHHAMLNIWKTEDEKIVSGYDFKPFKVAMDIGCGMGSFLTEIIKTNNHLKGYYFDIPSTFKESNIEYSMRIEGDFFNSVSDKADLYLMKNVIHNWSESKAEQILKNVRKAMISENGIDTPIAKKRLLIVENILPEDGTSHISNWMSLNFMILVDGRERTAEEYKELGKKCGFTLEKFIQTDTDREIIEFSINLEHIKPSQNKI